MKIKATVRFVMDSLVDNDDEFLFGRISECFAQDLGMPSDIITVEEDTDEN